MVKAIYDPYQVALSGRRWDHANPDYVLLLLTSLYGLKQVLLIWFLTLYVLILQTNSILTILFNQIEYMNQTASTSNSNLTPMCLHHSLPLQMQIHAQNWPIHRSSHNLHASSYLSYCFQLKIQLYVISKHFWLNTARIVVKQTTAKLTASTKCFISTVMPQSKRMIQPYRSKIYWHGIHNKRRPIIPCITRANHNCTVNNGS